MIARHWSFFTSWFFFGVSFVVATGGYDIITSITATIACLGNIGPGFGIVGPTGNYDAFPRLRYLGLEFRHARGEARSLYRPYYPYSDFLETLGFRAGSLPDSRRFILFVRGRLLKAADKTWELDQNP